MATVVCDIVRDIVTPAVRDIVTPADYDIVCDSFGTQTLDKHRQESELAHRKANPNRTRAYGKANPNIFIHYLHRLPNQFKLSSVE